MFTTTIIIFLIVLFLRGTSNVLKILDSCTSNLNDEI